MSSWLADLGSWAWARHHNVLSWYIRPLFLLPFCYFAYKRNIWGIVLTVVGLVTSMAWFPAPDSVSPQVQSFLDAEREYLTGEWTVGQILMGLIVPFTFVAIAIAMWRRSIAWALVVINTAILFKVLWSFLFSDVASALSHLPAALIGLVVVDAGVIFGARWVRGRYRRQHAGAHR